MVKAVKVDSDCWRVEPNLAVIGMVAVVVMREQDRNMMGRKHCLFQAVWLGYAHCAQCSHLVLVV
jgi:hypothetical protein